MLLDSFDNVHRFGPCIWPARGTALPQRGDLCKVMFDEEQRPFIVVWWPNDPTAGTTPGPDSIGTSEIKNGAVTTPKIADLNVTDIKIALGTIEGRRVNWHEGSAPPASPQINDLWLYHMQTGNSQLMRYEPDQDATYPWQFQGGAPAVVENMTSSIPTVFGVWEDLGGPVFTPARSGVYHTRSEHWFENIAGDWASGHMAIFVAGVAPGSGDHTKINCHFNAGLSAAGSWDRPIVVAAGQELRSRYFSTNVNNNAGLVPSHLRYSYRRIYIWPQRMA